MWKGLDDMGNNNNFGKTILKAALSAFNPAAGAVLIGTDVARKYKDYKEKQSWEESALLQLENACDSEQYEEAIKLANEILDNSEIDEDIQRRAKWIRAFSYSYYADELVDYEFSWRDEENKDAFSTLKRARDLFVEYGNEYGWDDDLIYILMQIDDHSGQYLGARELAIFFMDSDNKDYKSCAYEVYESNTNKLFEHIEEEGFADSIDYSHRKYVFIGRDEHQIAGTYLLDDDSRYVNWIFTIDKLPSDMVFPLGRPQPGLYMAHPVLTDHYYPMNVVEEALFMDKVREFCWFVQCLGAKMVSFHSNKGLSVSEGMGSTMNIGTNVGVKAVEVGASYGNTSNRNEDYNYNQKVELVQHFSPRKKPYCPDDLVWFDSDPAWQMLLKQRIEGGIMEYNYKISSNETCQMTSKKRNGRYM